MKLVFTHCLSPGANAVDWMVVALGLASRAEAVALGQRLLQDGYIQSATASPSFVDDWEIYVFTNKQ